MPRWTRRRLIRVLTHGIGVVALAPAGFRVTMSPGQAPIGRWLREWLPDAAAARTIGGRYLAEVPGAAQHSRALGRLLCDQPDAAARRALLCERRSRDFTTDDIVLIDGWVLAATEAQLCALVGMPA